MSNQNCAIIAIAVDKGGVGKTTTAINMAVGLAIRGKRILAVDVDQQANMTHTFFEKIPDVTLLDTLMDDSVPLPRYPIRENLDVVPACHKMFGLGHVLISHMVNMTLHGEETIDHRWILGNRLEPCRDEYDFILIDCPPSDNLLMLSALYAANRILIVTSPEPFCVEGVRNFGRIIRTVKDSVNPTLGLAGILITDFETGSVGHTKAESALRQWAPKYIFQTHIRHSRPLYNASLVHQDIFSYDPHSIGASDYSLFIEEFLSRIK